MTVTLTFALLSDLLFAFVCFAKDRIAHGPSFSNVYFGFRQEKICCIAAAAEFTPKKCICLSCQMKKLKVRGSTKPPFVFTVDLLQLLKIKLSNYLLPTTHKLYK